MLFHRFDKAVKYGRDVVRPGAGFGVALKTEGRGIATLDALQGSIKQ
jgi:hypothetical protein